MILAVHGGSADVPDDVELAAERVHPATHGRRGPAARARRDQHHQQRLPGHGPDRRDHPADLAARARDEARGGRPGRAGLARRRRRAGRRGRQRARAPVPGQVHRRAGPGARHRARRSARCAPAGWPTSCCGARLLRRPPRAGAQGRLVRLGAVRRGQRHGRGRRAAPLRRPLGRPGHGRPRAVHHLRVRGGAGGRPQEAARHPAPPRPRPGHPAGHAGQPAGEHDGPAGRGGPGRRHGPPGWPRPARRPGHRRPAAAAATCSADPDRSAVASLLSEATALR